MLELRFKSGPRAGQRVRLRSETVIGREDVDLNLEDREISRKHAVIRPTDDGFVIEDVGSLNGTFLNGGAVRSATSLSHGDVIELGQSKVEVVFERTAVPQATPPAVKEDAVVGHYQLGDVIRKDGNFTTHKAYQESLDRYVAVKLLNDPGDSEFRARFQREARILARLQHPNILPIYEQGEADGVPYLVVQYLDNETSLEDMAGRNEPASAMRLIGQVLAALDHAHRQGVVHRNLKPANILLPLPTWPMLAGFEIAKLMDDPSRERLTREGMVVGTPAYMAPEQAFGMPADARSDLYSAGIVLYELLTGSVPFVRDSVQAVLSAQAYESPPPARSLNRSLPAEVEPILQKALMKEKEDRYESATDMIAELERLIAIVEGTRREDPIVKLYEEGVEAFKRGRWERAVERLERLLTIEPSNEDAESLLEAARKEVRAGHRRR